MDWKSSETTPDEEGHICDRDGIAEHDSHKVIIDPETGERWALCWVRMPEKVEAERDELRESVKDLVAALEMISEGCRPGWINRVAREAIAKAKGGE